MRTILILVITFMLIATLGCDSNHEKGKPNLSKTEKPAKGIAAFRTKLDEKKAMEQ